MNILRNFALCAAVGAAVATMALDLPTRTVNGRKFYYYEVPSKETIYSITRKFGVTRDEIVRHNPQVADGLRAGDVLFFPFDDETDDDSIVAVKDVEEFKEPVVEKVKATEASVAEQKQKPVFEQEDADIQEEAADSAEVAESIGIAVMLPFMLDADKMTRQVENHTNFYKGVLMAVDSLAPATGLQVNVHAFDTEGSPARVAELMAMDLMRDVDFIIAPPDSLSIEVIAAAADSLDACVVNLFAVKNDAHLRHESMFQANIPHARMYDTAADAFCKRYAGSKVVFLNATDIPADKSEFTDKLAGRLIGAGIPYENVNYAGKLTEETLAPFATEENCVFIPTSHTREALMKILPALTDFSTANAGSRVRLFGYPEWVVLRGEIKDKLHRLNTTVYSRFSTDVDTSSARRIKDSYRRWFGTELPQTLPNTTLLGFDTTAWMMQAAERGLTEPFEGVQNSFRVVELGDGQGDVNNSLYFIEFKPSGMLNATVL